MTIPTDEQFLASPDGRRDLVDVDRLDEAAKTGHLSKRSVQIVHPWTGEGHFYCQKGCEADLHELADFYESVWQGRDPPDLKADIGAYLGYSEADLTLWANGGYRFLPPVVRQFMLATHDIRKAARIKALLLADRGGQKASRSLLELEK